MSRQGESRERTLASIKGFWEAEASEIGATPQVTIRDHCFRIHELHTLLPLIPRCNRLLDIGCGTGFGTAVLARKSRYTLGVDYSAGMLEWARRMQVDQQYRASLSVEFSPFWELPDPRSAVVEFAQGSLPDLDLDVSPFDVITGQRILINLQSRDDQLRAVGRLRKYSTGQGLLILTEATVQGHRRTDGFRSQFGLPPLEKYWHNTYVDEDRFPEWSGLGWSIDAVLGFDTYMLLSKVVYPAAVGTDNCQFLSAANVAALEIASVFRTSRAVDEIGFAALLDLFARRVCRADPITGARIRAWVAGNAGRMPEWSGLGHQKLIVARAC